MATALPTALDSFAAVAGTTRTNTSVGGRTQSQFQNDMGDAVEAIENFIVGSPWLNVRGAPFNAVGDGIADDTAAIQAALTLVGVTGGTVIFPPGTYKTTSPLVFNAPFSLSVRLIGSSRTASVIQNNVSDVFSVASANALVFATIQSLNIHSTFGGGHVFKQAGDVTQLTLVDCFLQQDNAAKSIWESNTKSLIELSCRECDMRVHPSASVPAWNLIGPGGQYNRNTWASSRCTCGSGAYFFHIESTSNSAWQYDQVFRDMNFENPIGGCIRALTVDGLTVDSCGVYDLTTSAADLFKVGISASSVLASQGAVFINLRRRSGTLGGGFSDIAIGTSAVRDVTILNPRNVGGSAFAIDMNSAPGLIVYDGAIVTIFNTSQATLITAGSGGPGAITLSAGGLSSARKIYPATDGNALQTVCGVFAGNGAPNNANGSDGDIYFRGNGTQAGNTVIYHREAGVWVPLITT